MRIFLVALLVSILPVLAWPAAASALERITRQEQFVAAIAGRELRRFGIRLTVAPDGTITGSGMGWDVTGEWEWRDGYFCRTLDWGGSDLGQNCQAVSLDGNRMRFRSDRGTGDYADFRLR